MKTILSMGMAAVVAFSLISCEMGKKNGNGNKPAPKKSYRGEISQVEQVVDSQEIQE